MVATTGKSVSFTPQKLTRLKVAYADAVSKGMSQFVFEGDDYVTTYAKYVIEYLDNQYKKK